LIADASIASGTARVESIGASEIQASLGFKVQPLHRARHAVDAALSLAYVSQGFNLSPAIMTELLIGRELLGMQLLLNLGYGQSLANRDRYARVRMGTLTTVAQHVRVGVDARASVDLGLEDDTAGEAAFDLTGGPTASYILGPIALSVSGGPLLLRFTDQPSNGEQRDKRLVGYVAMLGVGSAM
jgi:hypothetical protein